MLRGEKAKRKLREIMKKMVEREWVAKEREREDKFLSAFSYVSLPLAPLKCKTVSFD